MRSRSLFFIAIGASIGAHAVALFVPGWKPPQSAARDQTYRVAMVQTPFQADGDDRPKPTAERSVSQRKPPGNTLKNNIVEEKTQPALDAPAEEKEQAEPKSKDVSGPHDPAIVAQEESKESASGRRVTRWSPGAVVEQEATSYQRLLRDLRRLLQDSLRYPEVARRKGIEGAVAVTFTLNSEGYALDLKVTRSSGSSILDRAALRAVSGIFPYPDPPATSLHFTIPLIYRLDDPE